MERPKLKDYKNESLKSLSTHQYDLTEWSWWAEDRIKELEQQLSLHGVSQRSELLFCKCGSVKNRGYSCTRTDCDNTL